MQDKKRIKVWEEGRAVRTRCGRKEEPCRIRRKSRCGRKEEPCRIGREPAVRREEGRMIREMGGKQLDAQGLGEGRSAACFGGREEGRLIRVERIGL